MPDMICPTCGRTYHGLERFCGKCGIALNKVPNRCSESKTALCNSGKLEDDDLFCPFCGAPTTYAKGRMEGNR